MAWVLGLSPSLCPASSWQASLPSWESSHMGHSKTSAAMSTGERTFSKTGFLPCSHLPALLCFVLLSFCPGIRKMSGRSQHLSYSQRHW